MLQNRAQDTGGKAGKRRLALAFGLAMACGPWGMSAEARSGQGESLDQASARAHAANLLPIIADDVIDGERLIVRALPAGGQVGLSFRFRLRPEAVRYRPFCRMQIVHLIYDFARPPADQTRPVEDYDLLAMKRSGGFSSGGITTSARYLRLSPAPQSREDHAARCAAADRERGWVHAADDYAFWTETNILERLRAALADRRTRVALRCRRDGAYGCPVSRQLVLRMIDGERRNFQTLQLSDQREISEFLYYDEIPGAASQETRSIMIEGRAGTIDSVTIVQGRIIGSVI